MWSSLALSWCLVVQTMHRIRTTIMITLMRTIERGTTTAMVIVAFTDGLTGDVVSAKLVVSGGMYSGVVELKMASGEQAELPYTSTR